MDKETTLAVYGSLLIVGGSIGFVKAGSKMSLLAGGGSGLLCLFLSTKLKEKNFLVAAQVITLLLFLGMLSRAVKAGKFMPAGMVSLLSGLTLLNLSK